MSSSREPVRGEIYLCQFDPGRGAEQRGTRPAVVIERTAFSSVAAKRHVLVAAITTNAKCAKLPFCVSVERGKGTGLRHRSYVNLSHIHAFSKERLGRRLGVLPRERIVEVDRAIRLMLDV